MRDLKPWPNGTPNSSQLEPGYKIKTCIGGWPNDAAKSSQLARNHSIVWIPHSHITLTKQLSESWPNGGNLTRVGRQFELGQMQANSSHLEPSGWTNDTQFHRHCDWLGSSCLELGVSFGQGLIVQLQTPGDRQCQQHRRPSDASEAAFAWVRITALVLRFVRLADGNLPGSSFEEQLRKWNVKSRIKVGLASSPASALLASSPRIKNSKGKLNKHNWFVTARWNAEFLWHRDLISKLASLNTTQKHEKSLETVQEIFTIKYHFEKAEIRSFCPVRSLNFEPAAASQNDKFKAVFIANLNAR